MLREVNHIPPKMRLKAGSTILVPKSEIAGENDIAPEVADRAVMAIEPDVPDTRKITVKAGRRDTLASIAARNKVTVAQIRSWNSLKLDRLTPGQKLQLQVPYKVAKASGGHRLAAPSTAYHVAGKAGTHHPRAVKQVATGQTNRKAVMASAKSTRKPDT